MDLLAAPEVLMKVEQTKERRELEKPKLIDVEQWHELSTHQVVL